MEVKRRRMSRVEVAIVLEEGIRVGFGCVRVLGVNL